MATIPCLYKTSKFEREGLDDIRDCVRKAMKGANNWKAFYGIAALREAYLRVNAEIHIHVWFGVNRMSNFCAIYQRHPCLHFDSIDFNAEPPEIYGHFCLLPKSKSDTTQLGHEDLDLPVFIGNVQLVKKPKAAEPLPIPSVVRLQSLDLCDMGRLQETDAVGDAVGLPLPDAASGPFTRPEQINRETRIVITNSKIPSVKNGELASEIIECRPEIMTDFSHHYGPMRRDIFQAFDWRRDAEGLLSSLGIYLGPNNFIEFRSGDLSELSIKCVDLLDCPADFRSTTIQGVHALYCPHGEKNRQTKDSSRARDSDSDPQGLLGQSKEGGRTRRVGKGIKRQPEEVESQTSHDHRLGDCISKRTRSGSLEDA